MNRAMHTLGLSVALGLVLACGAAFAAAPAERITPLDATFVQLTHDNAAWPIAQWEALFQQFHEMNLKQVIVQWTEYEAVRFDTAPDGSAQPPVLETILQLADANDLSVLVGTVYDPAFWQKIDREPALVAVYLRRLTAATEALAKRLAPRLSRHPSFSGWYISQEIDDTSWRDPQKQPVLAQFLRGTSDTLRAATTRTTVALSGFANGTMDAVTYARFWDSLLQASRAHIVFFQDGVGAGKLSVDEVPIYLGPLRTVARDNDCELALVIELFASAPGRDEQRDFHGVPAPITRIQEQLALAYRHELRAVAFSIPDYMSPYGKAGGEMLYRSYLGMFPGGRP